ncbi:MAG: N-acetyl-gamma-glutamyl-phosphate reductase [Deltaproteobacteria bacterium]|nr:MAG: N-acetyl-gamma-glutamyl-phosphate reductase [Deltaproteobacteria bacterium]
MIRVGILGATGYAGAELVRLLSTHPEVSISLLTSRQYAGKAFDAVFPALTGEVSLDCQAYDADRVIAETDVVFVALPHQIPMGIVPELLKGGKKVIDLSADFRFRDASLYAAFYQPHTAPELCEIAVYGLSEVYTDAVATADLIGNPGCYTTSVLLPTLPLLTEGLIDADGIIADSKSGVSGAGRGLSLAGLFCEANESFRAYKLIHHRHRPEMEHILETAAGQSVVMTFTPHLVPQNRGILSTVYASLKPGVTASRVRDCLEAWYGDKPFIRIRPDHLPPDTAHVRGTNYCDMGFAVDDRTGRLILMSAIDNLVKGAAGQAIQNMNIRMGFPETLGLTVPPMPV